MRRDLTYYPCPDPTHENPHIDHCPTCLPYQWGKVPVEVAMSDTAAWCLRTMGSCGELRCPGMPDQVMDGCSELSRYGLAALESVTKRRTNYLVYRLTPEGEAAYRRTKR